MNKSAKDLDIEFSFVKIAEKIEEVSMNEYLEFFCMPGTLKINQAATGILSVMVKVNTDTIDKRRAEGRAVSTNLLKLLIAKVLETNMIYYFLFNVQLVN